MGFVSPLDGREYESVRSLRMSKTGAVTATPKLLDAEHGGSIAEGRDEVDKFLRQSMGFGDSAVDLKSIFADVIGVPQGRLTADFIDTPQARKAKFDPLLGTQDYRGAFNGLRQPLKLLGDRRVKLNATLAALEERLKDMPRVIEAISVKQVEAASVEAVHDQAIADLDRARTVTGALTFRKESLDGLRAMVNAGTETLRLHQDAFAMTDERVQLAQLAAALASASADDSAEFRATEKAYRELDRRLAEFHRLSAEAGLAEARQRAQQNLYDLAQAELAKLSNLHARLPDLERDAGVQVKLEAQLNEARAHGRTLKSAMGRFAHIDVELGFQLGSKDEYERRIAQAREHLELAAEAPGLQTRIVEVASAIAGIDAAITDLEPFKVLVERLAAEVVEEQVELASLDSWIADLHVVGRLQRALERAIKRGTLLIEMCGARLEAADSTKREQLDEVLQDTRERHDLARRAIDLTSRIPLWEGQVKQLSERIKVQKMQKAGAKSDVDAARDAQSEVDALQKCIDGLGSPPPRVALEVVKTRLGSEAAVLDERAEAYRMIQQHNARFVDQTEKLAPFGDIRHEVARLGRVLDALLPSHERHLKDSALAETLPGLLEERNASQAKTDAAAQSLDCLNRELDEQAQLFRPASLVKAHNNESALQTRVGVLQSRGERLAADLKALADEQLELRDVAHRGELARDEDKCTASIERVARLLRESLHDAGPQVTKAMVSGVSNAANEIFCEIMGGYGQVLQWDEEYGIWLETGEHRRSFRQLSGGEQITAALAVRLALLKDLLRIDTAFLDEPTQNLDATRRENLAEQIQRITGFAQLFVISHDDTFERLLQSVIHVEKPAGASRARVQ